MPCSSTALVVAARTSSESPVHTTWKASLQSGRAARTKPGLRTSWLKIRNRRYSQWERRRELFDAGSDNATRRRQPVKPQLAIR
jgi:hypothetical protein